MRTAERAVLVGIVVVAGVLLRIGFLLGSHLPNPLRADAGEYAQYAQNLVEYGVYSLATSTPPAPDSFRSPGYPLFLAIGRLVVGADAWQPFVLWTQVLLGGITILLSQRLARAITGFWPSLLAAVLVALSPHLVVASRYVLTECLTTFALVTALWSVLWAGPRGLVAQALAGLGLGVVVLCNESFVFLPLLVVAARWRDAGARHAIVLLVAAGLPFACWSIRNHTTDLARTGGQRVVASISHGSYPGMVFHDPRRFGYPYREDPEQPAFGSSWSELGRVLGPRIAAEPWRYASWYLLEKPCWLWRFDLVQGRGVLVYEVGNDPYERHAVMAATQTLMRWLHLPVMLLAAAGALASVWRWRRDRRPVALFGLLAVCGTLVYLPVIPDPRYLQPIRPVLFVLAAAVGASWVVALQRFVGRKRAASSAAVNGGASVPLGLSTSTPAAPPRV